MQRMAIKEWAEKVEANILGEQTEGHRDVDDAEEALIKLHRSYFNAAMNPHPRPLPMRYKSSYRDLCEAKNVHAGELSKLFNFK
jgi:hypothetical protein